MILARPMVKFANQIKIAAQAGVFFKDIFGHAHVKQLLTVMETALAAFAEAVNALPQKISSTLMPFALLSQDGIQNVANAWQIDSVQETQTLKGFALITKLVFFPLILTHFSIALAISQPRSPVTHKQTSNVHKSSISKQIVGHIGKATPRLADAEIDFIHHQLFILTLMFSKSDFQIMKVDLIISSITSSKMSIYMEPIRKIKLTDNECSKVPEIIDFDYICTYLRRVGLKIDDVSIKLGLNKIIHFLQSLSQTQKEQASQINRLSRQEIYSPNKTQSIDQQQKENYLCDYEPQSFVRIETSKSVISEKQQNIRFFKGFSNGQELRFSNAFKVKQVVTKNSLDEPETRLKQKVKFNSQINSAYEIQDSYLKVQKLEEQNSKIKKCMQNILRFFGEKKIIRYDTILDLQNHQFNNLVEHISSDFIEHEKQWEEKISNLSAKSYLLQETIQNLSISLRIEKQTKKIDEKVSNHQTQTNFTPQQSQISGQQLKLKFHQTQQTLQKLELLSFIKDEEIFSLKVMVSDLQNRLKAVSIPSEEKVRGKSYKKYFNITGQNLASTVR